MRIFHGYLDLAYAIMKGLKVNYNFNRKHQEIGFPPYELTIPNLELGKEWVVRFD